MTDRFIIIINNDKQLIDIACCQYYEDKNYITLKNKEGNVICFQNQQEAVSWVLNNIKKDKIDYDSYYLTEIKNIFIDKINRYKFLINP